MKVVRYEVSKYISVDGTTWDTEEKCWENDCKKRDYSNYAKRIHLLPVEENRLIWGYMRIDKLYIAHMENIHDANAFKYLGPEAVDLDRIDDLTWYDMDGKYIASDNKYVGNVVIMVSDCCVDIYPAEKFMREFIKMSGNLSALLSKLYCMVEDK